MARPSVRRTHHPTKGNKKGYDWRQRETRPLGRRTHHPTKGNKKGYDWRQRETRPLGRRTHHPTKGNKEGHNGRQDPRERGHTIQRQGGHFRKALRTPNSIPFEELWLVPSFVGSPTSGSSIHIHHTLCVRPIYLHVNRENI